MIFVALGTQDKSFKRLLEIAEQLNTNDRIVCQTGYTKYNSDKLEMHEYFDMGEYVERIKEADVVLCHGGVGTMLNCLSLNKKIIVVPRLKKYDEHQNDHQLQVARIFNEKGHVLLYEEGDDINDLYLKAKDFKPKPFVSNNANFVSKLKDYLDL